MIRRPPRSTQSRSSAASDVYKRQLLQGWLLCVGFVCLANVPDLVRWLICNFKATPIFATTINYLAAVSYTHLRAHETVLDLVCRLLLEKKKKTTDIKQMTIKCAYLIANITDK